VWRNGAAHRIAATLGEAKQLPIADASDAAHAKPNALGLVLGDGLTVEDASGPAARAGIQAGDIVLAVNGVPVKSADALSAALAKSKGAVALLVQRGDAALYVPVQRG
jgi:serine protease Do